MTEISAASKKALRSASGSSSGSCGCSASFKPVVAFDSSRTKGLSSSGGAVLGAPEDQPHGDRTYRAVDLEGHKWIFQTRVRDMSPDDVKAAYKDA